MRFEYSDEHERIDDTVAAIAEDYSRDYWREVRRERRFPNEIYRDLADEGLLGLAFPASYGGAGATFQELIRVIEALGENDAWVAGMTFLSGPVFGGLSVLTHGTERQRERYLPPIIAGEQTWALGVTEAAAGLNTSAITTRARRRGDGFVIDGRKRLISGAARADKLLLLARDEPRDAVESSVDGITMFVVDLDDDAIDCEEIPLDIYYPERTYVVDIDGLRVPETAVLGSIGDGLRGMFSTLNAERIAFGACAWGAGRTALDRAVERAGERTVWSEPIGGHQAVQHPLADAHASMTAARLQLEKAAWQYATGSGDVGEASNVANLLAGRAAYEATEAAMTTFGGMSVASETGIAAAWEFTRHARTIPISEEMIRNYIGQYALGLPQSYE